MPDARTLIAWLWMAALVAVLSLHIWFPPVSTGPMSDTYSVEIGGRNAFYQVTERRFPDVRRNVKPLLQAIPEFTPGTTLCLLGTARYPREEEWEALADWVAQGGGLLIAARWQDPELDAEPFEARVTPLADKGARLAEKIAKMLPKKKKAHDEPKDQKPNDEDKRDDKHKDEEQSLNAAMPITTILLGGTPHVEWKTEGKVVTVDEDDVLVEGVNAPQAVRREYGDGTFVLVASDYVFSNLSLDASDRQNGVLACRLLDMARVGGPVVFDESLNMTGTPKVVAILLDPSLRPITVQILVIFIVFAWRGSRRFGGLLPLAVAARHDISDHTNALGNLYYKTRDGSGVLRTYLDQLRQELKLKFFAGQERRILIPIARRMSIDVSELEDLLARAETAAKTPRLSRREAARFIRRLAEVRRAHRGPALSPAAN